MGNIKGKIKNDLWRWNYILPFVKKHQFDEKGKASILKYVLETYRNIHPVKTNGTRTVGKDIKLLLENVNIKIERKDVFVYFIDTKKTIAVPGNIISNFTLDYDKVVHGSFHKLAENAVSTDDYGKEAQAVVEGIYLLVDRILDVLPNSNMLAEIKEKRILDFQYMLDKPAQHFEEAMQRILFFNQIMWQTRHRLNGLGRLDYILDDLYKADKEAGILSKESASKLIGSFLDQLSQYSAYKSDALEGDIGQIIVLGGLNPDGTYFSNELTELFLLEQAKLRKPDPKTLLRVSPNMPEDLLNTSLKCLLSKTGSPLLSNDAKVIPALLDFGISPRDAYNYCVSACWEPYIVGKSLDQNNIAVFDFFPSLNHILNTTNPGDFETLVQLYISDNEKRFVKFLEKLNSVKWARDPLVSLFMDGCNEKRTDVSEGATTYNNYGITTVAISNVIDSLLKIKELVFDTQEYSLQQLNTCRNRDFEGYADIYKRIQESNKYFGHDDPTAVSLVERITANMSLVAKEYKTPLGGTVKFGLSSPAYNILSKKSGADFSGRKKGMPYNTHISCLDAAYTEVVNFSSLLSYCDQRFNGNVVDFFVAPNLIETNYQKFALFLKGAIEQGFFQMQMNVLDSKTLIDAKNNPQKYAGLIVRVWGFSAYFNDLPDSYKDLLIERAIAAERKF